MIASTKGVAAILGPTNTGKTHFAIERMLTFHSGMIGLPLRLLAREVYEKIIVQVPADQVALITGEEKLLPMEPRYWVCTAEAMPQDIECDFVAIDEVQLVEDKARGHIFTQRIMEMRGSMETLLLGSATMMDWLVRVLPNIRVTQRPRFSNLRYVGYKKVTRLAPRTAIVAFSSREVYAIAELIKRQLGGAAVVLGQMSPRTRNAQVQLFQQGDVDHIVATDAIGMGLNLDLHHVAFAATRKFDGFHHRQLTPVECAQIAGRAGRYKTDGTFGTTAYCEDFDHGLAQTIEMHQFVPIKFGQWRNADLDFTSLGNLLKSLSLPPASPALVRAPDAVDHQALQFAARDAELGKLAVGQERVSLLWDVCQIPDYRNIAPANHFQLISEIYRQLIEFGRISEAWLKKQIDFCNHVNGDLDTISHRLQYIRTWNYLANRPEWLPEFEAWQSLTRNVEERLSDALHHLLLMRFVDQTASALKRKINAQEKIGAMINNAGEIIIEGQNVGRIDGLRLVKATEGTMHETTLLRQTIDQEFSRVLLERVQAIMSDALDRFAIDNEGKLRWRGEVVAQLKRGERPLMPDVFLLASELLVEPQRQELLTRLAKICRKIVENRLLPLFQLQQVQTISATARGICFQLAEAMGVLARPQIRQAMKQITQEDRAIMRAIGVRFGAYNIFVPSLFKPDPTNLLLALHHLNHGTLAGVGEAKLVNAIFAGRTSLDLDPDVQPAHCRLCGFHLVGQRAIRIDILERLANMIRPLLTEQASHDKEKPDGYVDGRCFTVTAEMLSITGVSREDFAEILQSLGYRCQERMLETAPSPVVQNPPVPRALSPLKTRSAPVLPGNERHAHSPDLAQTMPETIEKKHEPTMVWFRASLRRTPSVTNKSSFSGAKGDKEQKKRPKEQGEAKSKHRISRTRQTGKKAIDPDSPFAVLAQLKR